jgi:hypothetical protein
MMSHSLLSAEVLSRMVPWGGAVRCEDKQECTDLTAGKIVTLSCAKLPGVDLAGERFCICSPFFGTEGEDCAAHVAGATLAGALHMVPMSISLGTVLFVLVTSMRYTRAFGSLPRTQVAASMLLSLFGAACEVLVTVAVGQGFVSKSNGTSFGQFMLRNASLCVCLASIVVNVLLLTLVFNTVVQSTAMGASGSSGRRSSVIVVGVAVFVMLISAVIAVLRRNALVSAAATVVLVTTWAFYVRAALKLNAMMLGFNCDGPGALLRSNLVRRTRVVALRVVAFGAIFVGSQVVFIFTTPEEKMGSVDFEWTPVCSFLVGFIALALLNHSIASYCCEPLLARLAAGRSAQTIITTKPLNAWAGTSKVLPVASATGS